MNEVTDDIVEVTMAKEKIQLDLPIQIGFFVYAYAKLRMLEFYYDFLDYYLDRKDFEYCEMDTDSAYIALSGPSLECLIRKDRIDEFYMERSKWLPSVYCSEHSNDFKETDMNGNPWTKATVGSADYCNDCYKQRMYDRRTPGLFKVEWQGKGIIALCSKTYYCFGETNKCSAKGIVKSQNDLNPQKYKDVLENQKSGGGDNRGFRVIDNAMYTYVQQRDALSYFYGKRQICEDNVSTLPLDI